MAEIDWKSLLHKVMREGVWYSMDFEIDNFDWEKFSEEELEILKEMERTLKAEIK